MVDSDGVSPEGLSNGGRLSLVNAGPCRVIGPDLHCIFCKTGFRGPTGYVIRGMEPAELTQALQDLRVDLHECLEVTLAGAATPKVAHPEANEILSQPKPEGPGSKARVGFCEVIGHGLRVGKLRAFKVQPP